MEFISRPKVVAAMPAYNEEREIGGAVMKARRHVDEVVVVDDGSQDRTAKAAEDAGAKVIRHMNNAGYGRAIMSCFDAARVSSADVLVILDADGQHDPDDIPRLIEPLLKDEADLTIGSRTLDKGVCFPRYRRFGINVINFLWNFGSKTKVSDTQCGFRAYSRKLLGNFFFSVKGMGISVEILEKARAGKVRIKEVPVSCSYEASSLDWGAVKHGFGVSSAVLVIRLKYGFLKLLGRG